MISNEDLKTIIKALDLAKDTISKEKIKSATRAIFEIKYKNYIEFPTEIKPLHPYRLTLSKTDHS